MLPNWSLGTWLLLAMVMLLALVMLLLWCCASSRPDEQYGKIMAR